MTWLFLALLQTANAAEDDGGGKGSWNKKPYWNPVVGGYAFNYEGQALYGLNLGAEVGLRYKQRGKPPKLVGRTRALGVYTLGTDVGGYEVRLGSFMGPWLGVFGVETGPDFIYNQYTYQGFDIGDSLGVYVPLPQARMSFKVVQFNAGLGPVWYFDESRVPVDWDDADGFGFGHEFRYNASAFLKLPVIGFGASWSKRITGYGTDDFVGLSFGL